MEDWIKKGFAALFLLWINDEKKYCAGALINLYKQKAYYGSYATLDSNYLSGKIGYAIQWTIVNYLKKNNFKKYETGWNYYKTYSENTSDTKLLEISKFKHGFGGDEVLHLTYKKEYELQ